MLSNILNTPKTQEQLQKSFSNKLFFISRKVTMLQTCEINTWVHILEQITIIFILLCTFLCIFFAANFYKSLFPKQSRSFVAKIFRKIIYKAKLPLATASSVFLLVSNVNKSPWWCQVFIYINIWWKNCLCRPFVYWRHPLITSGHQLIPFRQEMHLKFVSDAILLSTF